jgi:hypothetical protein
MEKLHTKSKNIFLPEKGQEWFDKMIYLINADKTMLETGTAPESKRVIYNDLFEGNFNKLLLENKKLADEVFTKGMFLDYMNELFKDRKVKINKLAFNIGKSNLLVWAQVNDDDFEAEKNLIMTEAIINAKYSDYNYYVSSTIVEKSDNLDIPAHYRLIELKF